MRKSLWIIVGIIALAAIIGGTAVRRSRVEAAQSKKADVAANQRPIPVVGAHVTSRDMPVYLRGLGTVIAFNTVTVKSRVDGELVKVNFKEGAWIEEQHALIVWMDVCSYLCCIGLKRIMMLILWM